MPSGRSLLGTTCPPGSCEHIRALILLPSAGPCARGSHTGWGKDSCPRSWLSDASRAPPLQRFTAFAVPLWAPRVWSRGMLRPTSLPNTLPSLPHRGTPPASAPVQSSPNHHTRKTHASGSETPCRESEMQHPTHSGFQRFFTGPPGKVPISGCTGSPQPRCPPGAGRPSHPAGISRLPGYRSARDPRMHHAQHLPPELPTAHQKEAAPALAGVPAGNHTTAL